MFSSKHSYRTLDKLNENLMRGVECKSLRLREKKGFCECVVKMISLKNNNSSGVTTTHDNTSNKKSNSNDSKNATKNNVYNEL